MKTRSTEKSSLDANRKSVVAEHQKTPVEVLHSILTLMVNFSAQPEERH